MEGMSKDQLLAMSGDQLRAEARRIIAEEAEQDRFYVISKMKNKSDLADFISGSLAQRSKFESSAKSQKTGRMSDKQRQLLKDRAEGRRTSKSKGKGRASKTYSSRTFSEAELRRGGVKLNELKGVVKAHMNSMGRDDVTSQQKALEQVEAMYPGDASDRVKLTNYILEKVYRSRPLSDDEAKSRRSRKSPGEPSQPIEVTRESVDSATVSAASLKKYLGKSENDQSTKLELLNEASRMNLPSKEMRKSRDAASFVPARRTRSGSMSRRSSRASSM